jgi:N-acetylneuraminic acid mutarotase
MPWASLSATPPLLRRLSSVAAHDNHIYITSGFDPDWNYTNRLDAYNITNGQWESLTAPGQYISSSVQIATSTDLFVFSASDSNKKYNFSSGQWSDIANQAYRCDVSMGAWDGNDTIYILGGYLTDNYQRYVYAYSISGNTFTSKPLLPARRGNGAAFIHNSYLYCVGGDTSTGTVNTVYRLQVPGGSSWSTRATIPTDLGMAGSVWRSDTAKFYLLCGRSQGAATSNVYMYDPAANQWSTLLDSAPAARCDCAAAIGSDGKVYLFGGVDSSDNMFTTDWQYTFDSDPQDAAITSILLGASAAAEPPALSAYVTLSAAPGFAAVQMVVPTVACWQVFDAIVAGNTLGASAQLLSPSVRAASSMQIPRNWQIKELGQQEGIAIHVSPSEYARTKQADVIYEQKLDGSLSRVNKPNEFTKEEYQIIWANVDRTQLDTLRGLINKKVEITDHLLSTTVGYVDAVASKYLLSSSPEQCYSVAVKINEA